MNEYEFWNELGTIFDAVLSYQRKTMEFNKRFISPWIQLGNVFGQRDMTGETIQALKQSAEIDPANAQNWATLGDALCKVGSYVDAVDAYKHATDLNPADGWTVSNLALALTEQGKFTDAISLYQEGIQLLKEPKDRAIAWNRLGDVYRKVNDYDNAFLAFQRADQLEATAASTANQAGESLALPDQIRTTQESAEVESLGEEEKASVPADETDTLTSTGIESFVASEIQAESAEDVAAAELGEDLNQESSMDSQIVVSAADGDQAELSAAEDVTVREIVSELVTSELAERSAVEIAEVAATVEAGTDVPAASTAESDRPTDADAGPEEEHPQAAVAESGETHIVESAYDEYLNDLLEPIRIHAGAAEPSAIPNEAVEVESAGKSTNSNGKDAHIWNELANVYLNSGRFDEAIAACIKAINLDGGFGGAHSNLALAYMYKGQTGEAVLHFQRSIELFVDDKDKALAWNRLGNLYRRQNDYDNAIAAYQMADELDPESTSLSLRSQFNLLGNIPEPKTADIS